MGSIIPVAIGGSSGCPGTGSRAHGPPRGRSSTDPEGAAQRPVCRGDGQRGGPDGRVRAERTLAAAVCPRRGTAVSRTFPFSSCLLPAFDSVTGSRSPSSASAVGHDACLLVSLSGPFVCRRQTPSVGASRGAHRGELCGWFGFPTRPVQPRGTDCPRLEPWD